MSANTSSLTIASMPSVCDLSYTVELDVTDNNGCSNSAEPFIVTVKDKTQPTATADEIIVDAEPDGSCHYKIPDLNTDVVMAGFDNDACSRGGLHFVRQSLPIGNRQEQTSEVQNVEVTVTVADSCGNEASRIVKVRIPAKNLSADLVSSMIDVEYNPGICTGESTTISVSNLQGASNPQYVWAHDANNHYATATVQPEQTTLYTVTITGDNGCTIEESINILVHPRPIVSIEPVTVCSGQASVVLHALGSSNNPPTHYQWYTGSVITENNKIDNTDVSRD